MPNVLKVRGFRFFFFSREGTEPPHIHVERGDELRSIGYSPFRWRKTGAFAITS